MFDCKSRKELDKIEGAKMKELISNNYKLINRSIAGRTQKEYHAEKSPHEDVLILTANNEKHHTQSQAERGILIVFSDHANQKVS